jgi:uncharacterized protein (DUF3820 family)
MNRHKEVRQSPKPKRKRRYYLRREAPLELSEVFREVMPFGAYRGQLVCRTPSNYLMWLASAPAIEPRLRRIASALLESKGLEPRPASQPAMSGLG